MLGGEENPANIPISVVLFSNEPHYVGGEPFRIMKLSAAFGHGEAVVGNKGIATDTVYLLQSRNSPGAIYVWYDAPEKLERLVPQSTENGITLASADNPASLRNIESLDSSMLERLFTLGIQVEEFFSDKPTDMELVIKDGTIHIVQARPINRNSTMPFYIDLENSALLHKKGFKALVSADCGTRLIDKVSDVLQTITLEEAVYTAQTQPKAAIVKMDEPLNSHPVINMSERNILSVFDEDGLASHLQSVEKGEGLLAICIQQEVAAIASVSLFREAKFLST